MNNKLAEFEFFKETMRMINRDIRKFRYRLKNHKFSQSEKKLLQAFHAYSKGKKEEALGLVKGYSLNNEFYEAVRLYVLGNTHNNFGEFSFAIEHLTASYELFLKIEEHDFITWPLVALILAFGNRRQVDKMGKFVEILERYEAISDHDQLRMINAELYYYTIADKLEEADRLLDKTLSSELKNLDFFRPGFLVTRFMIAFKRSDYENCYFALEEYKKTNGFVVKANYLYMKSLLDHIVHDKPLYVYKTEFKNFTELYHQLEIIKQLAVANVEDATTYWKLLRKHNPDLYGENFQYRGDYSLFSCALEKYQHHCQESEFDPAVLDQLEAPIDKLHYIFTHFNRPVLKADLIDWIWKDEYSEISMVRLRKLISSYRKISGKNIKSHQDTYFIKESA